ncbi:hypothetical protein C7E12_21980 [Stenotrophomonas maltophilia]|nr:hypothetical protein C7E12_21980 [Stenotrophomonas maltophilia]
MDENNLREQPWDAGRVLREALIRLQQAGAASVPTGGSLDQALGGQADGREQPARAALGRRPRAA